MNNCYQVTPLSAVVPDADQADDDDGCLLVAQLYTRNAPGLNHTWDISRYVVTHGLIKRILMMQHEGLKDGNKQT